MRTKLNQQFKIDFGSKTHKYIKVGKTLKNPSQKVLPQLDIMDIKKLFWYIPMSRTKEKWRENNVEIGWSSSSYDLATELKISKISMAPQCYIGIRATNDIIGASRRFWVALRHQRLSLKSEVSGKSVKASLKQCRYAQVQSHFGHFASLFLG